MSNLPDINTLTMEDGVKLSIETLDAMLSDCKARKKEAEGDTTYVNEIIEEKYSGLEVVQTGSASVEDGDYKITMNVPKRVAWDQCLLAAAAETIVNKWEGDPAEYMSIKYGVTEAAFKSWPSPIKAIFEDARTVKGGKATIKVERK